MWAKMALQRIICAAGESAHQISIAVVSLNITGRARRLSRALRNCHHEARTFPLAQNVRLHPLPRTSFSYQGRGRCRREIVYAGVKITCAQYQRARITCKNAPCGSHLKLVRVYTTRQCAELAHAWNQRKTNFSFKKSRMVPCPFYVHSKDLNTWLSTHHHKTLPFRNTVIHFYTDWHDKHFEQILNISAVKYRHSSCQMPNTSRVKILKHTPVFTCVSCTVHIILKAGSKHGAVLWIKKASIAAIFSCSV